MLPFHFLITLAVSLTLISCADNRGIHNTKLRDRVTACGGGFSEGAQASLATSLEKTAIKADASVDFKDDAKAVIFSEVPAPDRLKAYEDYIHCVTQK
jgi:hypothetical protein